MEETDYLPISHLNAFVYCPRRFYIEYVLGEMDVNEHVLEGRLRHSTSDAGKAEREGSELKRRRVYVSSNVLNLVGFVDVVEEERTSDGGAVLRPVEYKKGRLGRWAGDRVQLCAQAMCLEEATGQVIDHGFVFYFASRRRERVQFTRELREQTLEAIRHCFELAGSGVAPPPLDKPSKCRDCSLESLCLPGEVRLLRTRGIGSTDPGGGI